MPTLQCGPEGYWNGSSPRCVAVDCGPPPQPNYTIHSGVLTGYNATVQYTCWSGYTLVEGSSVLRCNASGLWQGGVPVCQGIY